MELYDATDHHCFVCGQQNPLGFHLVLRKEEQSIVADFQPREEHQGFPGVIHGGVVASILDAALGYTSQLREHPEWTMTGKLEIRYRRYVQYGPLLRVRATLESRRRRVQQARGVLTLAADEKTVLAEATGFFLPLPDEVANALAQNVPGVHEFFSREGR